jgi:hypothetical protein
MQTQFRSRPEVEADFIRNIKVDFEAATASFMA